MLKKRIVTKGNKKAPSLYLSTSSACYLYAQDIAAGKADRDVLRARGLKRATVKSWRFRLRATAHAVWGWKPPFEVLALYLVADADQRAVLDAMLAAMGPRGESGESSLALA